MKLPFKPGIATKASQYSKKYLASVAGQVSRSPVARKSPYTMTPKMAMMGRMPPVTKPTMMGRMRPALNKINNSALMNKMNQNPFLQKNAPYIGAALGATVVGTSAAVIGLRGKSSGGTGEVTSQNVPMY